MKRLKHPHIKNLFITRPDEEVAAHVAAGWIEESKPKRQPVAKKETSAKADADKAEKPQSTTSTGDGEE